MTQSQTIEKESQQDELDRRPAILHWSMGGVGSICPCGHVAREACPAHIAKHLPKCEICQAYRYALIAQVSNG